LKRLYFTKGGSDWWGASTLSGGGVICADGFLRSRDPANACEAWRIARRFLTSEDVVARGKSIREQECIDASEQERLFDFRRGGCSRRRRARGLM